MPEYERTEYELPAGLVVVGKHFPHSGEIRAALRTKGGHSVSLTCAGQPGWQDLHVHRKTTEVYVVLRGWIIVVWAGSVQPNEEVHVEVLSAGHSKSFLPGVPHNVFLSEGTLLSTTKVPHLGHEHPDRHDVKSEVLRERFERERPSLPLQK